MLGKLDEAVYKPSDQFSSRYGHAFHILMTQMSATKGLKIFGERAENAIVEEFKQLVHTENVFEPKMFNSLTAKQRHLALRAITLIKEKRDGKVKEELLLMVAHKETIFRLNRQHHQPCQLKHYY